MSERAASSLEVVRAAIRTLAPFWASFWARLLPRPWEPPVMRIV